MRQTYYKEYDHMDRVRESRSRRVALARARKVRRQKMLLFAGVLITVALCLFFSIRAFADTGSSKSGDNFTRKYASVMIYCGDTVGSVAEEYYCRQFTSVERLKDEIMSINHLSPDEKLIPGNYLIVPYYDIL